MYKECKAAAAAEQQHSRNDFLLQIISDKEYNDERH